MTTWCPGCSRDVDGVCHLFNCAIGPNGLDAQLRSSADSALLEKLADMIERGQCGDVWDINGVSEDDHARLPALLRQPAAVRSFSDAQLAEWVQRLDWDTGLTTADEIHQLRALLQHIGIPNEPQAAPTREQIARAWLYGHCAARGFGFTEIDYEGCKGSKLWHDSFDMADCLSSPLSRPDQPRAAAMRSEGTT